ncbi:MAG: hypothetical protein OXI60_05235 [Acidiferrobacterales bacterium]|nr:hypothetical protein [Acidiferrobacterales bacterium]
MSEITQKIAATLWALGTAGETIPSLPQDSRPQSEEQGREAQLFYPGLANDTIGGWKIAATSAGGQKHIGVSGPLEGPYLSSHIYGPEAVVSMTGNHMAVAETEFAFKFAHDLPSRSEPYDVGEVLDAVASLHPSVEFPDSRIGDFANAGAAALLADCACSRDWVIGPATAVDWRGMNLAQSPAKLIIDGEVAAEGTGADALGDPLAALQWVVNRLSSRGIAIMAGQAITTGVCGLPKPIRAGNRVTADLGVFGTVSAQLVD